MSYCRWSSDRFKSDVYVYENMSGYWTIHVASSMIKDFTGCPDDPFTREALSAPDWTDRYKTFDEWVAKAERIPIGLPYDGQTFDCESPGMCAASLTILKEAGYHVPDGVIESLWEEEKEHDPDAQEKYRAAYDADARYMFNKHIK